MSGSGYIDLRSDTVTRPTPTMRRAMADAEVGDDLFGDDPTVIRLQERAAALTGKQAALYLPTGTLCNQIAMHVFTRSGHAVVCEETAHVGTHELISSAMLSGITFRTIYGPHGMVTAAQVAAALEPVPYDIAVVDLVTVENTHQVGGGTVMPVAAMAEIAATCADRDVPLYLDGARIFNACAVTGADVAMAISSSASPAGGPRCRSPAAGSGAATTARPRRCRPTTSRTDRGRRAGWAPRTSSHQLRPRVPCGWSATGPVPSCPPLGPRRRSSVCPARRWDRAAGCRAGT
jgi:beta-eliminating lyase